jgi:pimeloyl-ACP methyl ester carboxylesterase
MDIDWEQLPAPGRKVTQPALFIYGDRDWRHVLPHGPMKNLVPNLQIIKLEGAATGPSRAPTESTKPCSPFSRAALIG